MHIIYEWANEKDNVQMENSDKAFASLQFF